MTRRSDFDRRQAVARLYDEACAAIDKERWQEAVEKLDRVRDSDLDFPGAEYRQKLAHKRHRIARLHEMGQQHMREGRWHEALNCFRQIRRDAEEYKNVALLQRYCERQLIPPPPPGNRMQLLAAGTALTAGVMLAIFGWQFTENLPPDSMPSAVSFLINIVKSQVPNPLFPLATHIETPGGDTTTPATVQAAASLEPTDDPFDTSSPNETAAPVPPGSTAAPRPTARPRPTRTATQVILAAATSTRKPPTNTPASAPSGSTATPTIAGMVQTATPVDTAAPAASVDPTPTPLPTATQQSGVLNFTETPSPTPADTATTAPTVPVATATTVPTLPPASATATATQPANTATATATLPAPTPTNSATPVPPTPTDSATPLPPTPTFTRTPTPVPPTATHTPTPVPTTSPQFITAKEFSFTPSGGLVSSGARVKINLSNQGTVTHDWVLKDGAGNTLARGSAAPGQLAQVDFVAPAPGVYTFVCDISDYAQQGMKGQLTVR